MNPYKTPCEDRPGKYDWSLRKRVFCVVLGLMLSFAFLSSLFAWQWFNQICRVSRNSPHEKLISFFLGW